MIIINIVYVIIIVIIHLVSDTTFPWAFRNYKKKSCTSCVSTGKFCLLIHLAVNGRAPVYFKTMASVPGRASNCSTNNNDLVIRQKLGKNVPSPLLHYTSEISCQVKLKLLQTIAFRWKLKTVILCSLPSITLSTIRCSTLLN